MINPIKRIKIKIVIVYFINEFLSDSGNGNRSETSISKIRNKIMIKKNCMENVGITGVCVISPHSNVFHFCSVTSVIEAVTLINIIKINVSRMLIIVIINIVIII